MQYSSKSSTKIMKYKTECQTDLEFHERLEAPLSTSTRLTRVNVITLTADGHLESIHSTDHHKLAVNAYPNVGFAIGSILYLRVEGPETECKKVEGKSVEDVVNKLKNYDESTLLPVGSFGDNVEEIKVRLTQFFRIF